MRICRLNPCQIHKELINSGFSSDGAGRRVLDTVLCQNNSKSIVHQTTEVPNGPLSRAVLWMKKVWKWIIYK